MTRVIGRPTLAVAALLCSVLAACPVGRQPICDQVPGCVSGCCDAQHRCAEVVCGGMPWVCLQAGGKYSWQAYAASCRDMIVPSDFVSGDLVGDSYQPVDRPRDTRPPDKRALDCRWDNCGDCDAGWCGPNAECRHNVKCRCVGQWYNTNGLWSDGCETQHLDCRPDNCNECWIAYCGDNADCMQNNCKCNAGSGYANCNGSWNPDGCECKGTCSGATCLP